MRAYLGGLDSGGVALYKKDFGVERLAHAAFAWEKGRDYEISLEAAGDRLSLRVDGALLLETKDSSFASGMVGCGSLSAARTLFGPFRIEELG